MSKKQRKNIKVQTLNNVSELGQTSKEKIMEESMLYDKDNYNPMNHLSEKEVLHPKNKSEVVTIRLSPDENKQIADLADENGLSKSAFIRMVVKRALKQEEYQ